MVDVVAYLFMDSWTTLGLKIIIIKEHNSMDAIIKKNHENNTNTITNT